MVRTEIKIAGYGGQGVITLGKLITATTIMHQTNMTAAQSESYGAAARGGACWTEVVLDDESQEIDYPRTIPGNVDIAILLTNAAVKRYIGEVKDLLIMRREIRFYEPLNLLFDNSKNPIRHSILT